MKKNTKSTSDLFLDILNMVNDILQEYVKENENKLEESKEETEEPHVNNFEKMVYAWLSTIERKQTDTNKKLDVILKNLQDIQCRMDRCENKQRNNDWFDRYLDKLKKQQPETIPGINTPQIPQEPLEIWCGNSTNTIE